MSISFRELPLTVVLLLAATVASADDWPHWRGPTRNDLTREPSGWRDGQWRIREAWRAAIGDGASSPLVIDDAVFVLGWQAEREVLRCLELSTGKERWRVDSPAPQYGRQATGDQGIYSGPSATPEYDPRTGWLYTLGIDGELSCRDVRDRGRLVWSINLYDRYQVAHRPDVGGLRGGASRRDYGYTTAPLVADTMLIVEVGDTRTGNLKGFDKRTGKELWTSECRDEAGHSGGPVPIHVEGIPCALVLTLRNLVAVRLDEGHAGRTLATWPWTTNFANNISTPAVAGNRVVVTTAYNQSAMCCLELTTGGFRELWRQENPSGVCSPVIHENHVYWAWRDVHCVDLESGRELWSGGKVAAAGSCLMTADGRLIVFANQGDLLLVESAARSPDSYRELAAHRQLSSTDAWPHVVLANGHLLCRDRRGGLIAFVVE